jgi:hypothetical protein
MIVANASAWSIKVENADGVTIFYNFTTSERNALMVTYPGSGYSNYKGVVVIPDEVTFDDFGETRTLKVVGIGENAFQNCTGLTSVTIGNYVTSIGENAFKGCTGLTSVTFGNSVTSIEASAFDGCVGLTSFTIPSSVTSIGHYAFNDCTGLKSITIPSTVTSLGNGVFSGCSGLTSVTYPGNTTSIGNGVFYWCNNLTSVTIPFGVTSIAPGTFEHCSRLASVTIPSTVTSIGNSAFMECSGLTSITIPNSVTSIESSAFESCGLTSVAIPGSVETIGDAAFYNCSSLTTVSVEWPTPIAIYYNNTFSDPQNLILSVPAGYKEVYEAADYWKQFNIVEVGKDMSSDDISVTIAAVTYNGSAQTPDVTVKDGTITLTNGTHYTVSYSNNTNAGTGTVTVTGKGNYTGTKTVDFTIDKAPLTVTAKSYTIKEGDALPTFEAEYSGFVNDETASVLTTLPTFTCSATSTSAPGNYEIGISGAEAANYSMTFVAGTLTITATKAVITIGSTGEGTYYGDCDLDFSEVKGLKAYIVSGYDVETKSVLLTRVNKVPAGTGLVVVGKPASYNVPISNTDYIYFNMLKGVVSQQTVAQASEGYTHFVMRDGEQGSAFYQLTTATEIPANSAYLAIPTSSLPQSGVVKMVVSGGLKGDVNEDGAVTITDAVTVVNIILNQ